MRVPIWTLALLGFMSSSLGFHRHVRRQFTVTETVQNTAVNGADMATVTGLASTIYSSMMETATDSAAATTATGGGGGETIVIVVSTAAAPTMTTVTSFSLLIDSNQTATSTSTPAFGNLTDLSTSTPAPVFTTIASSSSDTSATAPATAPATSASRIAGMSSGAFAGLIAGVVVSLSLLIVGGIYLIRWLRDSKDRKEWETYQNLNGPYDGGYYEGDGAGGDNEGGLTGNVRNSMPMMSVTGVNGMQASLAGGSVGGEAARDRMSAYSERWASGKY